MAQRSNHKFNDDLRDTRRSAGEGGPGSLGVYRDCSSSTHSRSSGDSRVFPFHPTPSGHLKVNSNQVVFESNKVSVLVADPVITKVNVKAESDTMMKLEGVGFDSSQQRKCALESQRLDAAAVSGREEYFYYNDCMTDDCRDSDGRADNEPELYLNRKGFSKSSPIDWKKLNLPAKSDLYGQLQNRIHNYIKPDCVVQIGNEEYCCHAIVLQCYSKYFDNLELVGNKNKIQLPEDHVSRRAYAIVYDWMIMPDTESSRLLRRDNILEIFRAAQFLQITELQQQCWAFLDNDEMFAEDTAFLMYLQAKKTGHTDVMQIMVPRIMKFFLCLVSSRDYIELNIDELCMILRSNYISVHTEMEVFMAAVRWLMFEWPSRQQYVEEVMSCIRFGHISPWTLVDIRRNPRNPPFLEVTNSKDVHTMIDDGLAFAIVKYWYANCPKDYAHWISILGITEPIGRNWIKPPIHYVTYDEFLVDLNYYRRVYLSDQKRAKNGKATTGKYYELPALPPKEHTYPHEVGVPFGPPPINEVPPPDLANILEQRRVRVKNKKNPPETEKEHPPVTKVPTPPADNNMESELRVVNFKESEDNSMGSSSHYGLVKPNESWPLPQQQRTQTTIAAPAIVYEPKSVTTIKPPGMLQESQSLIGKGEEVPLESKPSQKQTALKQMSKPVIVAPMLVQEYEPQPVQTYSSHDQRAQFGDQRPQQRSMNELPPQPTTEENNNSYHAVLMSTSKQRFQTLHMSQSVLGPISKNYMRDNSLFFADREAVLVLGGIDPHNPYGSGRNTGKDVFRFQPDSNSWELVGELPEPRHHHSVAFLKGRVFLAGGADPRDDDFRGKSVVVSTVWSFEPVSRAWFSETGMLTPRKNFGLVVSNGKLYAIGGQDRRGKVLSSVEAFDPNIGLWKEVAPTQIARTGMACVKFKDMIWVAGGMTDSLETPLTPTVECYDTRRNVWTYTTPLRFPRCFGRFFAMNDVLYLIGGAGRISQKAHSTASIAGIDVWDPNSKTWKLKAELVIPRHGHSLAYLGSQILIIGGVTTAYMRALNNVECYCCKRDTWIRGVNPLPVTLSGQGSITLPPASLL